MKKNNNESGPEALGRELLYTPREVEPNPELEREFEESHKWVEERERKRERAAKEMGEVWAKAFLSGGEEAAKKAVEDYLKQVEANKTDQEREEERAIQARLDRLRREGKLKPSVFDESPTSPNETSGEPTT